MSEILEELARVGFPVASIDELRRSGRRYTAAVPVLLNALVLETDYKKKEWIVRTLSVPWARPAAIAPLIREFQTLSDREPQNASLTRWAIGNALEVLWDDEFFDDFVALAGDRNYGRSREMLVLGFGKSKLRQKATDFLLTLIEDPDVSGHAVSALAKLAQPQACEALQKATNHPKAWIRKAAMRGIARIDKNRSAQDGESTLAT